MNEEHAKQYVVSQMRAMFPDDPMVQAGADEFEQGALIDVTAGLIVTIAAHPAYEPLLPLLQYALDVQRQHKANVHQDARKAVEQYRAFLSDAANLPVIRRHEGESAGSLFRRVRWQLGEELG